MKLIKFQCFIPQVQIRLDCQETVASALDEKLFSEFDIFGKMYLGADERVGEQERSAKVNHKNQTCTTKTHEPKKLYMYFIGMNYDRFLTG